MKTAPPVTLRDAAAAIEAEHGILLRARERVRLGCFVEVEVFFLGGGGNKEGGEEKSGGEKKGWIFWSLSSSRPVPPSTSSQSQAPILRLSRIRSFASSHSFLSPCIVINIILKLTCGGAAAKEAEAAAAALLLVRPSRRGLPPEEAMRLSAVILSVSIFSVLFSVRR